MKRNKPIAPFKCQHPNCPRLAAYRAPGQAWCHEHVQGEWINYSTPKAEAAE